MKNAVLLLCCAVALFNKASAQVEKLPLDTLTNEVRYEGIIEVPGATQDELYTHAKVWFSDYFKSEKAVIETDDKAAGLMIGKGTNKVIWTRILIVEKRRKNDTLVDLVEGWYSFTVKVYVKEGRFKYIITDIIDKTDLGGRLDAIYVALGKWQEPMKPTGYSIWIHHSEMSRKINEGTLALISTLSTALAKPVRDEGKF